MKSAEMVELRNYTVKALEFCFETGILFYLMRGVVPKEQQYEVLIMLLKPQRLLPRKTIAMNYCSFCCVSARFKNILILGYLLGAYINS